MEKMKHQDVSVSLAKSERKLRPCHVQWFGSEFKFLQGMPRVVWHLFVIWSLWFWILELNEHVGFWLEGWNWISWRRDFPFTSHPFLMCLGVLLNLFWVITFNNLCFLFMGLWLLLMVYFMIKEIGRFSWSLLLGASYWSFKAWTLGLITCPSLIGVIRLRQTL